MHKKRHLGREKYITEEMCKKRKTVKEDRETSRESEHKYETYKSERIGLKEGETGREPERQKKRQRRERQAEIDRMRGGKINVRHVKKRER